MGLVLTEEQEMLKRTARDFVRERAPVAQLRGLRDLKDPTGFSREVWKDMAGLGLAGMLFPEDLGGSGMGYLELGPVLEEIGKNLVVTPFYSTVLLAGNALLLGGSRTQRDAHLPGVCAGDHLLALAFQEGSHYDPFRVKTRAEASSGGFRLSGEKLFVLDGHIAETLLVTARTSGAPGDRDGITLFAIDAAAARSAGPSIGLRRTRTFMIDSRNAARIQLEGLEVSREAVVGEIGRGGGLLEAVIDRATIALCAEMLGGTQEVFDRTIAYLKERRQFGVPIGSFQALKHRAARLYNEIELTRTIVLEALSAIDEGRPDMPQLASVAKARCSDVFMHAAYEATQMHGGIGVTDELDIGFYLKRARVCSLTFGDAAFHRDRFARLEGY